MRFTQRLIPAAAITLFLTMACVSPAHANKFFSGRYKVNCPNSPEGCACAKSPESTEGVALLLHAQPVQGVSGQDAHRNGSSWVELKADKGTCFYPTQKLRSIYWETDICPDPAAEARVPLRSLNEMLAKGSADGEQVALGSLYPTFYNIADEEFHSGAKTEELYEAVSGKLIARVSKSFREDLDMEGTGTLLDGRVLNVANYSGGIWDYKILPQGAYGIGILEHNLHPYRSVAVDFVHLCQQAGLDFCELSELEIKKRLVGALLYMPKLRGISLPNGKTHDGFMCAQDVGGAIERDRVDIFVGPLGGGNPYLNDCRQRNPFIAGGVQCIVPTDWRSYQSDGFDAEGIPKFKRTKEFEYRTFASQKALEAYLVKGAFCKP